MQDTAPECRHLIVDGNDICTECGTRLDYSDTPEPSTSVQQLLNIIKIAEEGARILDTLIANTSDPSNPSLLRLTITGGRILRLPFGMLARDAAVSTYPLAQMAGFRGTSTRWKEQIVMYSAKYPKTQESA